MEHLRQSRPYAGLGFQVKVLNMFKVVPSLGSGSNKKNQLRIGAWHSGILEGTNRYKQVHIHECWHKSAPVRDSA